MVTVTIAGPAGISVADARVEEGAGAVLAFAVTPEQGLTEGQFNLGLMYSRGEGGPQDYQEAVKWCRLAAEQGDALARYNLGGCTPPAAACPRNTKRSCGGTAHRLRKGKADKTRVSQKGVSPDERTDMEIQYAGSPKTLWSQVEPTPTQRAMAARLELRFPLATHSPWLLQPSSRKLAMQLVALLVMCRTVNVSWPMSWRSTLPTAAFSWSHL